MRWQEKLEFSGIFAKLQTLERLVMLWHDLHLQHAVLVHFDTPLAALGPLCTL